MESAKSSRGSTIVEVMVAVMILAVAVSGMCGVLLVGSPQRARLRQREQASLFAHSLLQQLRSYVTADSSATTAASAPDTCWNLRNPPTSGVCPPGWALDPGEHDATFLLPAELQQAPTSMSMRYTVAMVGGRPEVSAQVDWNQ